jgi:hypothetical protein
LQHIVEKQPGTGGHLRGSSHAVPGSDFNRA